MVSIENGSRIPVLSYSMKGTEGEYLSILKALINSLRTAKLEDRDSLVNLIMSMLPEEDQLNLNRCQLQKAS
jgi:hypothetical protein